LSDLLDRRMLPVTAFFSRELTEQLRAPPSPAEEMRPFLEPASPPRREGIFFSQIPPISSPFSSRPFLLNAKNSFLRKKRLCKNREVFFSFPGRRSFPSSLVSQSGCVFHHVSLEMDAALGANAFFSVRAPFHIVVLLPLVAVRSGFRCSPLVRVLGLFLLLSWYLMSFHDGVVWVSECCGGFFFFSWLKVDLRLPAETQRAPFVWLFPPRGGERGDQEGGSGGYPSCGPMTTRVRSSSLASCLGGGGAGGFVLRGWLWLSWWVGLVTTPSRSGFVPLYANRVIPFFFQPPHVSRRETGLLVEPPFPETPRPLLSRFRASGPDFLSWSRPFVGEG